MLAPTPRVGIMPSKILGAWRCVRCFHQSKIRLSTTAPPPPPPPSPTPFVPNVETFLSLIGRDMSKHASKFSSWESLFSLTSPELRELGIEPARQRRYLLRQREKFKNGVYGPGGDLETVVDGVAQLRVVEVPADKTDSDNREVPRASATLTPGMQKRIVNLPPDAETYEHSKSNILKKFAHMKVYQGTMVKGPYLQAIKGTNGSAALIKVTEGMWEDKRGQKVDGGERRRAEVRAKKRSAERRMASS